MPKENTGELIFAQNTFPGPRCVTGNLLKPVTMRLLLWLRPMTSYLLLENRILGSVVVYLVHLTVLRSSTCPFPLLPHPYGHSGTFCPPQVTCEMSVKVSSKLP